MEIYKYKKNVGSFATIIVLLETFDKSKLYISIQCVADSYIVVCGTQSPRMTVGGLSYGILIKWLSRFKSPEPYIFANFKLTIKAAYKMILIVYYISGWMLTVYQPKTVPEFLNSLLN